MFRTEVLLKYLPLYKKAIMLIDTVHHCLFPTYNLNGYEHIQTVLACPDININNNNDCSRYILLSCYACLRLC